MKKANLFKVFSAHLATYALLLTFFAPVAVMAEAEPTPTPQAQSTPDMSTMTEADIEAMNDLEAETTGAVAAAELEEQNNGQSNLGEVDTTTSMWIAIISGIVIGYLSARLLAACKKKTYDLYLAAAAGIVYIYGEIQATIEDKETREEIEEAYDKCRSNDQACQYGALEAEKQSYDDIKKTAEDKAKLHEYSAMGLAAAAAWALGKGMIRSGLAASCKGAILAGETAAGTTGTAKCAGLAPNAAAVAACEAEILACVGFANGALGGVAATELVGATPQESALQIPEEEAALTATGTTLQANCNGLGTGAEFATAKTTCSKYAMHVVNEESVCSLKAAAALVSTPIQRPYGPHPIDPLETDNLLKKYFDIKVANNKQLHALIPDTKKRGEFIDFWRKAYFGGLDIFSPDAWAGGLGGFESYMGFGGAAIGIWYGLKKATATSFDMFIGSPYGRALFFGGMSAIVYYSASVTQDIADDAGSNSDKIASVLNNRRNENEEGTEIERQGREKQDVVTTTGNGTAPGTVATDGASDTPPLCANGENGNGGCNTISANGGGDTSFLDGFLGTNGASGLLAVANDVNDGSITAQSQQVVNSSAGSGAIAMKNLRAKKKKFFDAAKKNDPKSFDNFKKLDDYVQKSIQSGVQKVLKKNKATPAQFLAAVGTGKMPSVKDASKDARVAASAARSSGKKVGSIALGGASGKKDWSMKFNFDEEAAKEEVTAVSGNSETMAMSEENGKVVGSTNAEDIMGRNNNIWQEITKRYIRTAYPVLLEQL